MKKTGKKKIKKEQICQDVIGENAPLTAENTADTR